MEKSDGHDLSQVVKVITIREDQVDSKDPLYD